MFPVVYLSQHTVVPVLFLSATLPEDEASDATSCTSVPALTVQRMKRLIHSARTQATHGHPDRVGNPKNTETLPFTLIIWEKDGSKQPTSLRKVSGYVALTGSREEFICSQRHH